MMSARRRKPGVFSRFVIGVCIAIGFFGDNGAAQSAPPCTGGAPCPIGEGTISYSTTQVMQTAVGCVNEFRATFGSSISSNAQVAVNLCERNSQGQCVTKNSVNLTSAVINCCAKAIQDRQCTGLSDIEAENPIGFFKCTNLEATRNLTAGTTSVVVRFVVPYFADLSKPEGRQEICLVASELGSNNLTVRAAPYCVKMQVQRCSACLSNGNGLNLLAKSYGTHWSQIYSSNHDIIGNPDNLEANRLVRLGPLYEVQLGDTFTTIALKLGVSVNQLFFWNKHLARSSDPLSPANLPPGMLLCVLPRTCTGNFGDNQVVFNQRELFPEIEGGSWSDPYQVEKSLYVLKKPNT